MEHVIVVDIIGVFNKTQAMQNEFMQCADVFEKTKFLAEHEQITMTTNTPEKVIAGIHNLVRKGIEENGGYVLFSSVCQLNGKKYKDTGYYLKANVKSLSMLQKGILGWGVFKDILVQLGYDVVTTQDMRVTKIIC